MLNFRNLYVSFILRETKFLSKLPFSLVQSIKNILGAYFLSLWLCTGWERWSWVRRKKKKLSVYTALFSVFMHDILKCEKWHYIHCKLYLNYAKHFQRSYLQKNQERVFFCHCKYLWKQSFVNEWFLKSSICIDFIDFIIEFVRRQ